MKSPEILKITPEQANTMFAEVRNSNLSEQCKDQLILGIQSLFWIVTAYQNEKRKLFAFMKKMFGFKTERVRKRGKKKPVNNDLTEGGKEKSDGSQRESEEHTNPAAEEITSGKERKSKRHGRRSVNDFKKALCVKIALNALKSGDICPGCRRGTVYRYPPGKILCLTGQAPLSSIRLELEALRCSACGKIFKANIPEVLATQSRATAEAKAVASIFKYKGGMPFYRFDMLQNLFDTRVSKSELWEMVEDAGEAAMPIYSYLCKEAAKAEVLLVDDTTMPILELKKENEARKEAQSKVSKEKNRTGMFTTAILTEGLEHDITLYFTGRQHAGENLDELLEERPQELAPPIEGSDALSRNNPKNHKTQKAYCNSHNRRNFYDLLEPWPREAMHVLDLYSTVFYNEKMALEKQMTWEERMAHHAAKSGPVMEEIKGFCNQLLESKKVEPNSGFGKAIAYQNKHWDALTLFLRAPGAPLTTNSAERALKSAIRNRKNSLFYKTEWGAQIGDIHHSIIETCIRNGINPMDYLVVCQICSEEVRRVPHLWLPWNFADNPSYILAKAKRNAAFNELYRIGLGNYDHTSQPVNSRSAELMAACC